MRDQDRIDFYYKFGTLDRFSQSNSPKNLKSQASKRGFRLLRIATLLWALVLRNFSVGSRD